MLTESQLNDFRTDGHVTVPDVLDNRGVTGALEDISNWSDAFVAEMTDQQRPWYIEPSDASGVTLRKLDNPVAQRPVFTEIAKSQRIVSIVEQLLGKGVCVFFSQIFCKPPEVGGPKPVHQDNFYFGPDDPDATLTVWIALDKATVHNGCLFYGDGSHRGPIYPHVSPPDEPFNLQIPESCLGDYAMTAAAVPAGGISFHHGNTWHQSSGNTSTAPRRAAAFHYRRNDASLVKPALTYDPSVLIQIT